MASEFRAEYTCCISRFRRDLVSVTNIKVFKVWYQHICVLMEAICVNK